MKEMIAVLLILLCIAGIGFAVEQKQSNIADAKRAAHLIFLEHKTPVADNCRSNIKFLLIKRVQNYYVFIVEPDMKKCVTDRAWLVIAKNGLEYKLVTLGTAFSDEKDPILQQIFEGM